MAVTQVGTQQIKDGAVTLAKQANLAANSIIGNNTGSPAVPIALTLAQIKTLLGLNFAENETPSGTINGSNATFTLANTPVVGSVCLCLNGVRMSVANSDYSISGDTITMLTGAIPQTGDSLLADYRY